MDYLNDKEFVIFDVETTGLSPAQGDRIVEIAAIKVKNWKAIDRFHSLIDPQRDISWGAYQVNGISPSMLQGAPSFEKILPHFMDFLGTASLVGHNIQFDLGFLMKELSFIRGTVQLDMPVIDTLRLARQVIPHLASYKLWFVARSLGIVTQQHHRAMADVELTVQVFIKLLSLARERNIDLHRHFCTSKIFR